MTKLTHEQLSRILGEADVGLLNHSTVQADRNAGNYPCGCAGGAALVAGWDEWVDDGSRLREISEAIGEPNEFVYPRGAEAVLRMLEERGLA